MLDDLADDKVDQYLDEHLKVVPLGCNFLLPSLPIRMQFFVSRGPLRTNLLGLQGVVNRKNSMVDTLIVGI